MSIAMNDMYLLEHMPEIMAYKNRFDTLNGLLNKTTLTGKISSLEIAENLFMFMDDTQQKFSILQDKLINTLVLENYRKVYSDNYSNAQAIIDIIVRSLQERTKDIQSLSKDSKIASFLQSGAELGELSDRFEYFFDRYTIYANLFLFDTNGTLKYSFQSGYEHKVYNDRFISDALRLDGGYVQTITDNILERGCNKTFLFSAPVKNREGMKVGAIALEYDLDEEIGLIFKKFTHKIASSATILTDENGKIVASSNLNDFQKGGRVATKKVGDFLIASNNKKDFIFAEAESNGYRGYKLPGWKILILTPIRNAYLSSDISKAIINDKEAIQEEDTFFKRIFLDD